jgi:hypothetical protein
MGIIMPDLGMTVKLDPRLPYQLRYPDELLVYDEAEAFAAAAPQPPSVRRFGCPAFLLSVGSTAATVAPGRS